MAEHAPVVKNLRDGQLTIVDGSGNRLVLVCDQGNLKAGIPGKAVIQVLDRGALSHLRYGDERPMPVSFGIQFKELLSVAGSTPKTVYEALKQIGACVAWTSVNNDGGGVYCLRLVFEIASPTTGETGEEIEFPKFFAENVEFSEGDPNTLEVSGISFALAPTIDKEAAGCGTSCETGAETDAECATGCETGAEV